MSTLFLVPLLYGGQEQIVRQMRDELLNSSREVQKEAKAAWSAWRSFRLGLDLLCLFVTGKPRRLRGRLVAQAGGCEERS